MLEKIREMFARLAELTSEELAKLRADIQKAGADLKDATDAQSIETLGELADMGDAVKARASAIKQEEADRAAAAQAARDRLKSLDETDEGDDDGADGDNGDGGDAPAEGDEVDAGLVPVAAGGARQYKGRVTPKPVTPSPELNTERPHLRVLAASQLVGMQPGEEFLSREQLAIEMSKKLSRMDKNASSGRVTIASATWLDDYAEDRHLRGNERDDARKLDTAFRAASRRRKGGLVLAASGGVPLPTNVDYAEDTWATADRPIRAGLDPFAVDRGGLLYRQPPALAGLAGATTIWTNANDIDPTDPTTKPVLQITSPDTTQVFINAVPTRLGFGNLMGQFDPETIAANTDLAMAAAARIAETSLWQTIAGFGTNVTQAQVMGASRDLFQTIIQATAAYRFQFRLPRDLPLSILLPTWALDIMKADRVWELAHDSAGSFNPFAWTDAQIEADLNALDVYPIWALDALPVNTSVNPHYVSQNFTAFTQNAAVPAFPTQLFWNIFIKGSLQFLDGGRLDLGVVRDSTLDATNDYETFVETFENVANRGFAGSVIGVVSNLLPTGASSEGIAA